MGGFKGAASTARGVVGERLTTWSASPDGSRARLGFADKNGRPYRIDLPVEAVGGLLMTLPRVLQHALDLSGDAGARMVQPLGEWRLEQMAGTSRLILTLSTPDGFSVAFALAGDERASMAALAAMADGHEHAAGPARPARVLN